MADESYNSCGFNGDVLSYLYNEMSEAERDRFESHLEACETCVNEFAILSDARYSVYEWKAIEFAPMETPAIIIPIEPVKASWLDVIKTAFAFPRGLVAAGAGFAAIALIVSVSLIGFSGNGIDDKPVVRTIEPQVSTMAAQNPVSSPSPEMSKVDTPPSPDKTRVEVERHKPEIVKASVRVPKNNLSTTATKKNRDSSAKNVNAPRLVRFDDNDDDSLRLAELFNDIDTRDLDELD